MDEAAIRSEVLQALKTIAPEIDPASLRSDRPLREEVDLDSMDWLRFMALLHQRLGVSIPEEDYWRFNRLDDLVGYLQSHLA
ncbi:acyl carrier protein [Pseudomonas schmalbachii]|uniref:Acyl carrier protein n=1 Tax=Pseudomonas schmalbachii TaxID=2816993 RepID=A0ABS3TJA2_9PSED|nr:acyl carrier protein [Pseudomonas schmalbachii]MBO3273740.1 acyl carrier protein [Pseudomonas schmalbachii]